MRLSREVVEHIADLARLQLSEVEKERFAHQLGSILEHVARLQELDTAGIPPTSSVLPDQGVLRTDEARPGLTKEELLRNAPEITEDQFRVPPILE
jgi:aspartyl-tRNA(Asn)/glutamyl-tRNA(Gln) amidotransferase subunit C